MGEPRDKTGHINLLNRTLSRRGYVNINLHVICNIMHYATEIENTLQ